MTAFRMHIGPTCDTCDFSPGHKGPHVQLASLWYPRIEENPDEIRLSLDDVRAADDLIISYDYKRDGWVVQRTIDDPELDWDAEPERYEVAFIPAWTEPPTATLAE